MTTPRRRRVRAAVLALGLLAVALVASAMLGSRPEALDTDAPVAACPDAPNCARVRVAVAAPPEAVRDAARRALASTRGLLIGSAREVVETSSGEYTGDRGGVETTPDGALATFAVGPFIDDVAVAVEPAPGGSVLWVRSASRAGRSDLGVNRRRVAALVSAIAEWLPEGAVER